MNKIEKLLEELCPNGVEWKELGEIASVSSAGVDKKKVIGEKSIVLLNYMDVYKNRYIDSKTATMVVTSPDRKIDLCNIEYGDIFFTPSSETEDDIFKSAVAIEDILGTVYSYHIMRIRLNSKNFITSCYLNFYFESYYFKDMMKRYVKGNTRKTITKTSVERLLIPIPPLEVQEEIVKILDKFTEYVTELTAELTLRNKHYEYYREKLLTFKEPNIEWKELKEICSYSKERISYIDLNEENYVTVENILDNKRGKTKSNNIPLSGNFIRFDKCDILLGNIRPYLKKIWFADTEGGSNNDVLVIKINDTSINTVNSRFLYQVLSSDSFFEYNIKHSRGAKMPRGNKEKILEYKIPIPPLNIQKRIVEVLDNFEAICKDLNIGLPKEIELRQKQYEFYREKLLTFDGEYGKPKLAETTITD